MEQEKKTCAGCKFFYQHYICNQENQYTTVACGHCTSPRLKDRRPNTPACQHFSKKAKK